MKGNGGGKYMESATGKTEPAQPASLAGCRCCSWCGLYWLLGCAVCNAATALTSTLMITLKTACLLLSGWIVLLKSLDPGSSSSYFYQRLLITRWPLLVTGLHNAIGGFTSDLIIVKAIISQVFTAVWSRFGLYLLLHWVHNSITALILASLLVNSKISILLKLGSTYYYGVMFKQNFAVRRGGWNPLPYGSVYPGREVWPICF